MRGAQRDEFVALQPKEHMPDARSGDHEGLYVGKIPTRFFEGGDRKHVRGNFEAEEAPNGKKSDKNPSRKSKRYRSDHEPIAGEDSLRECDQGCWTGKQAHGKSEKHSVYRITLLDSLTLQHTPQGNAAR